MKKIRIVILFVSIICGSVHSQEIDESTVQKGFLKSGITISQCKTIVKELNLPNDSCDLIIKEYEPFVKRAEEIVKKMPAKDHYPEQVMKIARILKEFPTTTDEEFFELSKTATKVPTKKK